MYPQQLSHGNVLTFTPPGFKHTLNVKFPDCRLAVCEKCKKNYKTRDMCRVRNSHTAEPWTTAYICFTLDDNCTGPDGKYVDKPFAVRMIQWQPYCVKTPFDPKTPVCSACKKTNRTRSFCRERHKHRQLPWCTVYVLLSPADSIDPATRVAPESTPISNPPKCTEIKRSDDTKPKDDAGGPVGDDATKATDSPGQPNTAESQAAEGGDFKAEKSKEKNGGNGESDDINDIAESRTFLAKVSCKSTTIHWLELAEFDATDVASMHGLVAPDGHMALTATAGMAVQPMDPAHYYAHAMGSYAAQQHQFNLKSHQQYFFQIQQRQQQQYAAQQAAWQAQYNQRSQMQLAATTGQAPLPPSGPPGTAQANSPAPVTAGEAAAQQQTKQNGLPGQPQEQAGSPAAVTSPHGQWPTQQMMYPPHQIYHPVQYQQPSLAPQAPPGQMPPPPGPHDDYTRASGGGQQGEDFVGGKVDDMEPAPVHQLDGTGESDPKRQRIV